MEKPPVNPTNNPEIPKAEQSVEGVPLSEQEKNIQEVFKLCPELESAVYDALGLLDGQIDAIEANNNIKTIETIISHKRDLGYLPNPSEEEIELVKKSLLNLIDAGIDSSNRKKFVIYRDNKAGAEKLANLSIQHNGSLPADPRNSSLQDVIEISNLLDYKKNNTIDFLKRAGFEGEVIRLYAKYLETIFPESKVRDILWHATEAKIDVFKENQHFGTFEAAKSRIQGILEGEAPYDAYYDGSPDFLEKFKKNNSKYYPVLLNIKHLKTIEDGVKIGWENEFLKNETVHSFEYVNKFEHEGSKSYIIRNPEHVHILGSKSDIEKFKEFVSKSDNVDKK